MSELHCGKKRSAPLHEAVLGQRRGERAVGQQDLMFCFLGILSPHLGLSKHCPVLYPPLNSSPLPLPQFRGPIWHTETASQKHLSLFLFVNLSYLLTNEEKKIEQIKLFTTSIPYLPLSSLPRTSHSWHRCMQGFSNRTKFSLLSLDKVWFCPVVFLSP